jgi:hypothetical protein
VTDKKLYTKDSGGNVVLLASNGGDVTGPASSTNLAIPTFSGTGGKTLLNNSGATITAGVITATGFSGPLTGNAATVTTNANLTGPITSVGNATSIASQTGTGTKFVVDTSPTITGATLTTAALNGSLGATTPSTVEATTVVASSTIKGATTIGVGNATPSTSGAGITFPATQSASTDANTLDDYEEGTFTPAISPWIGAFGSVTYNTGSNLGYYTKVGSLVSVTGIVYVSSYTTGTASSYMKVSLPFAQSNSTQNYTPGVVMQYGSGGYTPSIPTANVALRVEKGNSFFTIGVDNNVTTDNEAIGTFSVSGFFFRFSVTYISN